ncbi:MAG: hypothetical protein WA628_15430 [Terriglobales bacterium]
MFGAAKITVPPVQVVDTEIEMLSRPPTGDDGAAPSMRHYFFYDQMGNVHVESVFNGERWQHHVHTRPEFLSWCALVPEDSLVAKEPAACECDLAPGQVLEGNGRIWKFPPLAEEAASLHE